MVRKSRNKTLIIINFWEYFNKNDRLALVAMDELVIWNHFNPAEKLLSPGSVHNKPDEPG